MVFQDVIFWVLAVGSVTAALGVVLLRDIFRAALLLVVVFLAVAGFFVMMNAEFLAVVQVLIYAGAIAVLIIFAIMLTREVQRGNLANRLTSPAAVLFPVLAAGRPGLCGRGHRLEAALRPAPGASGEGRDGPRPTALPGFPRSRGPR